MVIRRPRPSPRPGRRLGPPQVWTLSSSKPSKPLPLSSFPNRHPRARATAMTFYELSKLPFASPQRLQTPPKFQTPRASTLGPRQLPQQAPQGQATAMAFLGFQSCRLPARKPSKTLQNSPNPPNPPNAPNPPKPAKPSKHRPQQAPQIHSNDFLDAFKAALTGGQGHSNDFLWASKLQFGGPGPQQ